MKKNLSFRVSIVALVTIVIMVTFSFISKKEIKKEDCKKCCQQNCLPETPKVAPEYIFYETLNGHLIVSNYKQ